MINIGQFSENIRKIKPQFSLHFFIACLVLTIAFLLAFIANFKTYTSSLVILINAKSEIAAIQEKQITGNALEFPQMLSFYDRLLKYNSDVRDVVKDESQAERKEFWSSLLSVKKIGRGASLIEISITTEEKNDAEQLAQKTVRTLFDTMSLYYDIKNDLDLRIIDGPITKRNIFGWWWMLPISLLLGFLTTTVLQKMITIFIDALAKQKNISQNMNLFSFGQAAKDKTPASPEAEIESLKELYMSDQTETVFPIQEKSTDVHFQEMKKLTKMTEENKYPNFREIPKEKPAKAAAPDNLPIADDSFFMQADLNIKQKSEPELEIKKHEPTADELKERLNKLLQGTLQ